MKSHWWTYRSCWFGLLLMLFGCSSGTMQERMDDAEAKSMNEEMATDSTSIDLEEAMEDRPSAPSGFLTPAPAITEEKLVGYEELAIQKLKDYAELVTVISDPGLDKSFRKQAQKMVSDLFSEETTFSEPTITNNNPDELVLKKKKFLNRLFKGNYGKVELRLEDISLATPFTQLEEDHFSGVLSYSQVLSSTGQSETKEMQVDLLLEDKAFGDDYVAVWRVIFGGTF